MLSKYMLSVVFIKYNKSKRFPGKVSLFIKKILMQQLEVITLKINYNQ